MEKYQYPGHYEVDGVVYNKHISQDSLIRIRDELILDKSDMVLVTYPKSGTIWMSEIYYQLMSAMKKGEDGQVVERIASYLEFYAGEGDQRKPHYENIVSSPSPRSMKTHLPAPYFERILQDGENCPKFLVVIRNPKDTLVSFYHFHRMMKGYDLEDLAWDDFFEMYKRNAIYYGDVIDHHVGWWKYRDSPNVLIISYEELLESSIDTIGKVADFLNIVLSAEDINAVVEETSFKQMKSRGFNFYFPTVDFFNEDISPFIRKGKQGDWQSLFSIEQSAYVDNIATLKATPVGIKYAF